MAPNPKNKPTNGNGDKARSAGVPGARPKQPPPATAVPDRPAAAANKKKPRADAGPSEYIAKATDKPVPPSANGGGYGGGSTSTGASAGTTAPKDKATNSPVPEVKPKQSKEKSKNQN